MYVFCGKDIFHIYIFSEYKILKVYKILKKRCMSSHSPLVLFLMFDIFLFSPFMGYLDVFIPFNHDFNHFCLGH